MGKGNEVKVEVQPGDIADYGSRAPYVEPTLTVFGSVRELTRGSGGSCIDGAALPGSKRNPPETCVPEE
jgi:hypothetical protein